jgi:hypothetical protein
MDGAVGQANGFIASRLHDRNVGTRPLVTLEEATNRRNSATNGHRD